MIPFSFPSFLIVSFFGGMLSLFSPCSGSILPTYFAYTFKTKRRLLPATFIFFLGLVTTAVPLGVGVSFVANLLFLFGNTFYKVLGVLFILLGLLIFSERLVFPKIQESKPFKNRYISTFSLGFFSGLTLGTCSGPVLGAIATLAGLSGSYTRASIMMIFYTLGIAFPLFLFSLFIERFKLIKIFFSNDKYLNIFSGTLFILLGIIFVYYRGSIGAIPFISGSNFFKMSFDLQEKLFILFSSRR